MTVHPERDPVVVFVALGANLGDPRTTLHQAFESLGGIRLTKLVRTSRLYRTAPIHSSGPDYLNAVAELQTRLDAPSLLAALQAIEAAAGRERPYRNAPRTLDLDLLLYGSARIESACLTVPHPRMQMRAFVLVPLHEIAPERVSAQALQAVAGQSIEPL
jgi:2-amino-4-hydroxy-6-hydroxymethyldihydropteridine diphosphokinase